MNTTTFELHSPLTLLNRWRDDPDRPRLLEALIMGFTVDLVFLERFWVPVARALGARLTVLADAHQAVHDPVDVRHAGRSYQHGHVVCGGAFHPKVVVLLGEHEVWTAIGSGNPTMSGWGHNHELWLVVRSSLSSGPVVLRELGRWLTDLPDVVAMPSWVADTVRDIGRRIVPQTTTGAPEVSLLHNLHGSLIGQLPESDVGHLGLSAPFFDPNGSAVRALASRLRPRRMTIALQEGLGSYDGAALVSACGSVPTEYRLLEEDRTRHGKLVEWAGAGGRTALVGSANITAAALLRSVPDGGNCELVVHRHVPETLLPDGAVVTAQRMTAARPVTEPRAVAPRPTLTLLGCRLLDGGLLVELVVRAAMHVRIDTSIDGSPASWRTAMSFTVEQPGRVDRRDLVPEVAGGVVRAVGTINGTEIESAHVFLTDVVRCLPRADADDRPALASPPEVDEVFTDLALAARFKSDLLRLIEETDQGRTSVAAARSDSGEQTRAVASGDRWASFLNEVQLMLGESLTRLIFPGSLHEHFDRSHGWTVGGVDDGEVTDDENESVVDNLAPVVVRTVPYSERARYRGWAQSWVRAVAGGHPSLSLRMTVTCLHLDLLAAGVWGVDQSWRGDLRKLVGTLTRPDDELELPNEALEYRNTLIAGCLALLRQDTSLHGGGEADIAAQAAWRDGKEAAAFASTKLIEGFLRPSTQADARVFSESEVEEIVELAMAATDDPHADALETLAQEGIHVERQSGAWVVETDRGPLRVAARAATLLGPSCVAAHKGTKTVVLLWHGRTLAMAASSVPRWRIYRINPPGTPQSLFADEGVPFTRDTHELKSAPDSVIELASATGVDITMVIATCIRPLRPRP